MPRAARAAPYEGYAFAYFTGNTIAGEKIYFAASRGNNALRWDELNGGQPVLESTLGEQGPARPVPDPLARGRQVLPDRHRPLDRRQRRLGRARSARAASTSRSGSPPTSVNWCEQRHVQVSPDTAGNTWAPEAYWDDALGAVRRVLGVEALRRRRPGPHRQHLQPDALRHHARLRHVQRAEDLAGPRRVAHRLHGDQGGRHLLPLHQGRGRRRHRLLRHHPGEADRR